MDEIRFHPEAQAEYQTALVWYHSRSPQAAARFELLFEDVLGSIAANPLMFPKYDNAHRFATLGRFPFSLVYQAQPGRIYIIAVAHSRRSPNYWQGRA